MLQIKLGFEWLGIDSIKMYEPAPGEGSLAGGNESIEQAADDAYEAGAGPAPGSHHAGSRLSQLSEGAQQRAVEEHGAYLSSGKYDPHPSWRISSGHKCVRRPSLGGLTTDMAPLHPPGSARTSSRAATTAPTCGSTTSSRAPGSATACRVPRAARCVVRLAVPTTARWSRAVATAATEPLGRQEGDRSKVTHDKRLGIQEHPAPEHQTFGSSGTTTHVHSATWACAPAFIVTVTLS